jgi:hypothetical protein
MDSIRKDFERLRTPQGLFSNSGGESGNQILFTGEAILCMRAAGVWSPDDQAKISLAIAEHCSTENGLIHRGPGYSQDQISVDDYIGLGVISPVLAGMVMSQGAGNFWYFKTGENPSFWAPFLGRFPALWAHLAWCSNATPNWFLRLAWVYSVAFGNKNDQDSWILNGVLVRMAGHKGWLEKWATRQYIKKLEARWGNLNRCLATYFGSPDHPIAKHWPTLIPSLYQP